MNLPRTRRRRRVRLALAAVLIGAAAAAEPVRGEGDPPASELVAVGSDTMLWLIVGRWQPEEGRYLQFFSCIEPGSAKLRPARQIEPQVGRIRRAALVDEALHVFFSDDEPQSPTPGAHYRYTEMGSRRERQLPGRVAPKALAGAPAGASRPGLWAVVSAETADAVEAEWQAKRRREAESAGNGGANAPEAVASPAGGAGVASASQPARAKGSYHLVQYDGADWQPGFPAPEACRGAGRLWLCASTDRHHLLWQDDAGDLEIHHAWHEGEDWQAGPPVRLSGPPHVAFAAVINAQLHFTALIKGPAEPQRLQCESQVWLTGMKEGVLGRWESLPSPQGEDGGDLRLPVGSAVGAFGDQLAFVRPGKAGEPELSLWPTKGGPAQPFCKVPVPEGSRGPRSPRTVSNLAALVILGVVLALVFWRRQESVAFPAVLPADLLVASVARRSAAVAVDMLPAGALVLWLWFDPIASYVEQFHSSWGSPEDLQALVPPGSLFWAWICFRLVYTGYCTLFELLASATPGKRLLGCAVLSESVAPPTAVQIAIRNVTRLVELEPYLLIWPFLLVIFITRNRQRIGDLLARTIVVTSRGPVAQEARPLDESEDGGGPEGPGPSPEA